MYPRQSYNNHNKALLGHCKHALKYTVGVKSLSPVNKFALLIDMPTLSLITALYRYRELVFT